MYVHHDQAVVDRVLALAAAGVPKLTIANDLGINVKTVRRWVATDGVRQPRARAVQRHDMSRPGGGRSSRLRLPARDVSG